MYSNYNKLTNKPLSVIVGLSGGVDSAVAALMLQQQGFQVAGMFMKNWEEDDDPNANYCSAAVDLKYAEQVCELLNIKLHKVNFAAEYWDKVFTVFLQEYKAGRTPNPDVLCNKEIKFKVFLDYAKKLNADFIATGHYVKVINKNNQYCLLTAKDNNKDQTYFLHALSQQQLAASLFPLGNLTKPEVRQIAQQAGFNNYNKKDSTGICFIGERKFKTFLQNYLPAQPGFIITNDNNIIGQHDGLMYYTIGQRKYLNINNNQQPWFVVGKDLINNKLIVAPGKNNKLLYCNQLYANNCHWINNIPDPNIELKARIRHRQTSQPCTIELEGNKILVTFQQPQRAVTPGQFVVFYQQEQCLGGAVITEAIH